MAGRLCSLGGAGAHQMPEGAAKQQQQPSCCIAASPTAESLNPLEDHEDDYSVMSDVDSRASSLAVCLENSEERADAGSDVSDDDLLHSTFVFLRQVSTDAKFAPNDTEEHFIRQISNAKFTPDDTDEKAAVDSGAAAEPAAAPRLAVGLALLSMAMYCGNGELLQALQTPGASEDANQRVSPLLNLCLCHMGGLVFAPWLLRRKPKRRGASKSLASLDSPLDAPLLENRRGSSHDSTSAGKTAGAPSPWSQRLAALGFSFLLMAFNYAWLSSAAMQPVRLTNAVFQTSVAFVYVANVLIVGETPKFLAAIGVALALAGASLAAGLTRFLATMPMLEGVGGLHADTNGGAGLGSAAPQATAILLALCAAVGVTVYQITFRQMFGSLKNDPEFIARLTLWIGIWHLVLILPLVWLASFWNVELLAFPTSPVVIAGTLASAVIAATKNLLDLCVLMWGSPMLFPCTAALSVPFQVLLDALLHGASPSAIELLGHLLVVTSVVLIMELHAVFPPLPRVPSRPAGNALFLAQGRFATPFCARRSPAIQHVV